MKKLRKLNWIEEDNGLKTRDGVWKILEGNLINFLVFGFVPEDFQNALEIVYKTAEFFDGLPTVPTTLSTKIEAQEADNEWKEMMNPPETCPKCGGGLSPCCGCNNHAYPCDCEEE